METKQLYLYDSYQRDFEATIQQINNREIVLDQTAFHPLNGGVACDTGFLSAKSDKHLILQVAINRENKEITHFASEAPNWKTGDIIQGEIDWLRRYRLMRLHTAAHLIAAVLYRDYHALITGGQVNVDQAKLDFNLEKTERKTFEDAIAKANAETRRNTKLKVYFLERSVALKVPGIVKLAERMPPDVQNLRIVEIPGIDLQADGGPHVNNTHEIGDISILKVENKGKMQRRVYFTV